MNRVVRVSEEYSIIKDQKLYVNSKELSKMIGIPVTAIQRLVRQKRLPCYQLDDKQYLFKPDEVEAAIKGRRIN